MNDSSQIPMIPLIVLGVGFLAAASIGSLAWFRAKRPLGWKESDESTGTTTEPGAAYDRGIEPAEVTARRQREGQGFKQTLQPEADESDRTGGFTVDREGLANNYAVEPEMYIEQPGDLEAEQKAETARRAAELREIREDGGKGPGVI